jgi:hypothetical protein
MHQQHQNGSLAMVFNAGDSEVLLAVPSADGIATTRRL